LHQSNFDTGKRIASLLQVKQGFGAAVQDELAPTDCCGVEAEQSVSFVDEGVPDSF
jgi:hypothetical protein